MKNHFREITAFCSIFVSLFLFVGTFALAAGDNPSSGQKLFQTKCAQCHGKDAKGVAKMAKVLKVDPTVVDLTKAAAVTLTDGEAIKIVGNGQKKMPKFKGKLSDAQIVDAVKYLRTLQGSSSADDSKGKKK